MIGGLVQATLKNKFVSCPAGGHNCGQSGGRKIFFFPLCIEMVEKNAGKKRKIGKYEKNVPTRPL